MESRPEKLAKAIESKKIVDEWLPQNEDYKSFLDGLLENKIAELFDDLKEKYGRDIFEQGY